MHRQHAEELERPSWNIPPTATSWVGRHVAGELVVDRLTWGFQGPGSLVSNARVETAAEKHLFRDAWRGSRCVVPVDGWYEWKAEDGHKQPFYFTLSSGDPTLLAGLWNGDRFVLLTAETHGPLRAVHTRRPVALARATIDEWLRSEAQWDNNRAAAGMVDEGAFAQLLVSDRVNSTRNDGPELLALGTPSPRQGALPL
jgi:putative SOS response-associated peptidase YedK